MTRLVQGGDDTAVIEMEDFGGQTILRTVTTASGTQSVRYAGPFTFEANDEGAPGAVIATQYGLPGGVRVSIEGGVATATVPDLDGSAMATITLPALAGKSGANGVLAAADRFGPYGERLMSPVGGNAVRDYTWRAGVGLETLPGSASITIMGARPYHPGLGEFLTPDPLLDGGDALYAYTSGDPINFRDPSGGSEQPEWAQWLAAVGGGIAAVVAGFSTSWSFRAQLAFKEAKVAAWISGIAGSVAVGAGTYLAVTADADSDTAFFAAGIAIAAVGATAGVTGVVRGVKNVRKYTAAWQRESVASSSRSSSVGLLPEQDVVPDGPVLGRMSGNRASNVEFNMEANPPPSVDFALQPGWAQASRGSDARRSLGSFVDNLEGPTNEFAALAEQMRPPSIRPSTVVSQVDEEFQNWLKFQAHYAK
jgi:RHS repeat-associated protein